MPNQVKITGMKEVLNNLNKELNKIEGRSLKGLIRAAIQVRYDMEKTPPLIPVDTGNLRASFFTVSKKGTDSKPAFKGDNVSKLRRDHLNAITEASGKVQSNSEPLVILGFSAQYAVKVHEDTEAHRKRKGSGPFFLSQALNRNQKKILDLVREEAKIR